MTRDTSRETRAFSGWDVLGAAVILLVALWIYWPVLRGDWLWDDDLYILNNPLMNDPGRLWKIWSIPHAFREYYPVEATIQWTQWILWGENTLGYHLTNVALHVLSALLVWRLLGKLGVRQAWLGALLFTVHPVMVESVAWMVELKNTLSLPLLLLAMCIYIDYDRDRRPSAYALTWFAFLLAMLCKISVMMFPFVVLLYAWWKRNRIDWHDLRAAAGFLFIAIALGAVSVWAAHVGSEPPVGYASPSHRFCSVGWFALIYLFKAFVPVHLLPLYPTGFGDHPWWLDPLPWLILAGAIAFMWTRRATWGHHALLGFGFYLINLAPFSVFMLLNYTTMTWSMDHGVYISMVGLFGLAAAALSLKDRLGSKAVRLSICGVITAASLALCAASHAYAAKFVNRETLWRYTAAHNPKAVQAFADLAHIAFEQGHLDESVSWGDRAIFLAPNLGPPYLIRGIIEMSRGDLPAALDDLRRFRQFAPDDKNIGYSSLWIWIIQSKQGHVADADGELAEALAQSTPPGSWPSDHARFLLGRIPEAEYLAIDPGNVDRQCEVRYYAGAKRLLAGDKIGAEADFRACVATGKTDFFEYVLAQGELRTLGASP